MCTSPTQANTEEQRRLEMIEKSKEAEAIYREEYAKWAAERDAVMGKRNQEMDIVLAGEKKTLTSGIDRAHADTVKQITRQKEDCLQEKAEAEAHLASLGFFRFADKSAARDRIETLSARIAQAEQQLEEAHQDRRNKLNALPQQLDRKKKAITPQIEGKYPLPPEPQRRTEPFTLSDGTTVPALVANNERIAQAILDILDHDYCTGFDEIRAAVPDLKDAGMPRMAALTNKLLERGLVDRFMEGGKPYFVLK